MTHSEQPSVPRTNMPKKLVVYVDVDDTLVRSFGSKRIPMSRVVEHVRQVHKDGAELYCWSSGGAAYAEQSAEELGIHHCFAGFLPKPNIMLDDVQTANWPFFTTVHPSSCASQTFADYLRQLGLDG